MRRSIYISGKIYAAIRKCWDYVYEIWQYRVLSVKVISGYKNNIEEEMISRTRVMYTNMNKREKTLHISSLFH